MDYLDKIPKRIKYYLLDWKDSNMDVFNKKFGDNVSLRDLNAEQIAGLFSFATHQDTITLNL